MIDVTKVSFPGLGIAEKELNKVAFTLFNTLEVRWYGILLTLGIVIAFLYVVWRGKGKDRILSDDIIDVGLWTVVLGVIGARVYYVITDSGNTYDSILEVIAIWNGGLAIYGAIIGGVIGILIGCRQKKISWRQLFDMAAPAVIIAQAVGRWGNFVNGEAHGYEIAETTKFYFFSKECTLASGEGTLFHLFRMGLNQYGTVTYYHPTFLYESIWSLLGFILLNLLYEKRKYKGQLAIVYFTWYGFGRMWIEGLRTDSLYLYGTGIRVSQLIGLLCFLVGSGLLTYFAIRKTSEPLYPEPAVENMKTEEEGPSDGENH